MSISLTTAANSAAQFLGVLDSGESLSPQQLTDALSVANRLLLSWYQEQSQAMFELVAEHTKQLSVLLNQQGLVGVPLATAYTLANGSYLVASFSAPTWTPGTAPQFVDQVTVLNLPNGYDRAVTLALAIELAPQYGVQPMTDLLNQYAEARAAANPMPGHIPVPGQSTAAQAAPKGAE